MSLVVTVSARPGAAQCPDGSPPPCAPRIVHLTDSLIAIVPFHTVGASLGDFGEGLVYLLSANLDGAGGLTTVAPQRTIERTSGRRTEDPAVLAGVARGFGAATVVSGTLVPTGAGGVRLIVNVIEVRSAGHRGKTSFTLDGAESSLGSLADSASLILLSRLTRVPLPQVALGARLSPSVDALRAFIAGERAVRAARYDEADSLFEKALDYDSTFALAYYRRFVLRRLQATNRPPEWQALVRRALALSGNLPERERRLLHASRRGGEYLDSTDLEARIDFVTRYPDDAEGWWWLEDWYFHAGAIYGYPLRSVVEAGERAIENRSNLWMPYGHALWAAGRAGDTAAVSQLLSASERFTGERYAEFRTAWLLRSLPADSGLRLVAAWGRASADSFSRSAQEVAIALQFIDPRMEAMRLLEAILAYTPGGVGWRIETLAALGRFAEAQAVLDSAGGRSGLSSPARSVLFAETLIALAGLEKERTADSVLDSGLRVIAGRRGVTGYFPRDLLVLLRPEDSVARAERAEALLRTPVLTETDSAAVALDSLRIAARLTLHRGDTAAAIRLLEPVTRVADGAPPFAWHRLDALDQYLLAVLYAARGDSARARATLDRPDRGHAIGGGVLGLKLLLQADLDAAAGDTASARGHYTDVVALWKDGDAVVQPYVQRARTALARLEGR